MPIVLRRRRESTREFLERLHRSDREFTRELVLRMERSERAMLRELQDFRDRNTAEHRAMLNEFGKMSAEHDEMVAELRAGRGALLSMLDRLGPGGSAA